MKTTGIHAVGTRSSEVPDDDRRRRSVPRIAVLLGLAAAALLVASALFAWARPSGPKVGQDQAVAFARQFFDGAHGSGATVNNVQIESIALDHDTSGRIAWRVIINGNVTEAGATTPPSYFSTMVLFVDAETGAVTVFAQG